MADPEYLSMRQARERVRRSRRTLRRWMANGMPFIVIGGRKFIRLDDLQATLRQKLLANPTRKKPPITEESSVR